MRNGDYQLGIPQILYRNTKANIETLPLIEGGVAYATDTNELGTCDGIGWAWGAGGGVQSVTGDGVNNIDPANPVMTYPTPSAIGAATAAQGALADSAVQSIVAGANITVDNTDPANPIVSASFGGGNFQRNLTADVVLADGECLIVAQYINTNGHDIIMAADGDCELVII